MYARCGGHRSAVVSRVAVLRSRSLTDAASSRQANSATGQRDRDLVQRKDLPKKKHAKSLRGTMSKYKNLGRRAAYERPSRMDPFARSITTNNGLSVRVIRNQAHPNKHFIESKSMPNKDSQTETTNTAASRSSPSVQPRAPSPAAHMQWSLDPRRKAVPRQSNTPTVSLRHKPSFIKTSFALAKSEPERYLDPYFRFGIAYIARSRNLYGDLSTSLINVANRGIWHPDLPVLSMLSSRLSVSMVKEIGMRDYRKQPYARLDKEALEKYKLHLWFDKMGNSYIRNVLENISHEYFCDETTPLMEK
ncbi:hypothetical protein TWF694_002026 [Orbilia ellipsospora]|uniref:Uncharacterized protein n=1 Tax=Orbilia ellipsospora TaxID=2528407 RepID=A0AAV9X4B9_9PEZI